MSFAQRRGTERLLAVRTLEGTLGDVDVHVTRQRAVGGEHGMTDVTAELLHALVGPHVRLQYTRRHKRPVTRQTFERLLPCQKSYIV